MHESFYKSSVIFSSLKGSQKVWVYRGFPYLRIFIFSGTSHNLGHGQTIGFCTFGHIQTFGFRSQINRNGLLVSHTQNGLYEQIFYLSFVNFQSGICGNSETLLGMSLEKTFEYAGSSCSAWFWAVDHKLFELFEIPIQQSDRRFLDKYKHSDLWSVDMFFFRAYT